MVGDVGRSLTPPRHLSKGYVIPTCDETLEKCLAGVSDRGPVSK